jgi:hypothetical protein
LFPSCHRFQARFETLPENPSDTRCGLLASAVLSKAIDLESQIASAIEPAD